MGTDFILFFVAGVHLSLCPYTKVEESFNLQAIHDVIYLRTNFSEYDHHEFPGVVPRTFLGPLVTSAVAAPVIYLLQYFELHKFYSQCAVRAAFGTCVLLALLKLKRTIVHIFGNNVANWFVLITASQFHFMFYLSRTLPNIMALPLVLLSLHWWLRRQYKLFLWCGAAAVVIFRFELALFFGFLVLFELFYRRITLMKVFQIGIPAALVCLVLTVTVDSFIWQKLLWPEGEVLWFNLILNRSSEWGTSPFLWYFYSAIPRGLALSLLFVPLGAFYDSRVRRLLIAPTLFVLAYSILPHKELRFIIYVFPLFNIAAAVACARLWMLRSKSSLHGLLSLATAGHLLGNTLFAAFLLSISVVNYPGGYAISRLHQLEPPEANVSVHISNLAAQTGVSRFTQLNPDWNYDKRENITYDGEEFLSFTHLLFEAKTRHASNVKALSESHDILDTIKGFSHVSFNYNMFPPVKVKTKPCIFILKKKNNNFKKSNLKKEKIVTHNKEVHVEDSNLIDANLNIVLEPEIVLSKPEKDEPSPPPSVKEKIKRAVKSQKSNLKNIKTDPQDGEESSASLKRSGKNVKVVPAPATKTEPKSERVESNPASSNLKKAKAPSKPQNVLKQ